MVVLLSWIVLCIYIYECVKTTLLLALMACHTLFSTRAGREFIAAIVPGVLIGDGGLGRVD